MPLRAGQGRIVIPQKTIMGAEVLASETKGRSEHIRMMEPLSFTKTTLPNGLDVILHPDPTLPIAAVNVWYHVGSKDEELGKTGFAHLFEHMMFEGSKHHNRSFFEPLQRVGANLNGSTTEDRTNYWENLPANYLELALWLEADRMGFLLDAVDQRRFDIQRDVVKNERRQSYENRPYGMATLRLQGAVYPAPHPYHWPVIGSQEDLDAASLEDVHAFFKRYYHPANASLAIAGDFDLDQARALVERYFGDLPPGPALPRLGHTESPLRGRASLREYDRVLLPRLYLIWPSVPRFDPDEPALSLLAMVLGDGRASRLHQALVYTRQIAQSANAYHGPSEIAGEMDLVVTGALGEDVAALEAAAWAEIERLKAEPPTDEEITRVKNRYEAVFIRQLANVGGFGGRADRLNAYNVLAGDPGQLNREVDRFQAVQPEDIRRVAQRYLGDRYVNMVVLPEPQRTVVPVGSIDRSVQPAPAPQTAFVPPTPERYRLSNGLGILVLEQRGLPLVSIGLTVTAGSASDPGRLPGLTSFTSAMLQEGTKTRTSQQIASDFEFIGSALRTETNRESLLMAAQTLTRHWERALELLADVVQNSTFPDVEIDRVQRERITDIRRLRDDPTALADRIGPMLLYGPESPYGHPGLGTEKALTILTRDDLAAHFREQVQPERATLIVVGDVSAAEVLRAAETQLGGWRGAAVRREAVEEDSLPTDPPRTTLYLVDKPGAAQSVIRAGHSAVPRLHPDYFPLMVLNHIFGGDFSSRLNSNLRQDKGYSYGYRSWFEWHRRSSLLLAGGGVQTAVTKEAVEETLREFEEIRGGRPVSEAELEDARAGLLRQFPSRFETPGQILEQLSQIIAQGLPNDYFQTWSANVASVSLEQLRSVAAAHVRSGHLTLLVVGDRGAIEPGLRALDAPLYVADYEGNVIETVNA